MQDSWRRRPETTGPSRLKVAEATLKMLQQTFAALLFLLASPALAALDAATLLQLVDYVGVDYVDAVAAGEIVDQGEYAEMQEFAARILEGIAGVPATPERGLLEEQSRTLVRLVAERAQAGEVAELTRRMRDNLLAVSPVASLPARPPGLGSARSLYVASCASCHGESGRGDGPAARDHDPPPIDFHDAERARRRSLYGLYNTITLGVAGTGMAGFSALSEDDRWALAFYVGAMAGGGETAEILATGEAAWEEKGGLTLREAVTLAPEELDAALPQAAAMAAWARRHPEALFAGAGDPLAAAVSRVEASAAAYGAGNEDLAQSLAVSAYLDGFELSEAGLRAVAPDLVRSVEASMMELRSAIGAGAPAAEIVTRSAELTRLLRRSRLALERGPLTGGLAFTGSLVILVREGLEAILILAAIAAFLVRTGRREAMRYVHLGWITAIGAGIATWAAATWLIDISGAAREVTEGATALLAAGVLFYVGFWMHGKLHAQRWNQFLQERVQSALDGRAALGLTFISFLAVYREVFETVLFYQALWGQVEPGARGALIAGLLVAVVLLAGMSWFGLKLGQRLPLRQFFGASAAVMFALTVVFAGKGIVALQEAGTLPISPVAFPRIELLGIYPSLEGLAVQLALLAAAITVIWWGRRQEGTAPTEPHPANPGPQLETGAGEAQNPASRSSIGV